MKCLTYRSSRKDGVYLYLLESSKLEDLPKDLLDLMGKPKFMLSFELSAERKLVKIDAKTLIDKLLDQGYYLRIDTALEENNLLNEDRKRRGLDTVKNEKLL